MAAPDRSDSATALAHTPFFTHLGRLDLARLAGELEELHFQSGQAIVQEGDGADGFYVMKAGRIVVAAGGASGALEPLTTLGPGEAFGEIALLSGERRIALGIPIARGMTEAMGYGRQSPGRRPSGC